MKIVKMAEAKPISEAEAVTVNKKSVEVYTGINMVLSEMSQVPNKASASGSNSNIDDNSYMRTKMLARVALSDAHFKHQQRGEADLNLEQKIEIAQSILDCNNVTFLSRFWNYLELEDLEYFKDCKNVYEVDFYVKQVTKNKNRTLQRNKVKNRRYEAMKELISKGEYFSEDEMKFREPYLYEQMVGQYLTQEDIQGKVDKSDLTFSSILLKHIDQLDENVRFGEAKDKEDGQEEEEEDDVGEQDMEIENRKMGVKDTYDDDDKGDDDKPKIPEKHKQELKVEFLTIMQEMFLRGDDIKFDYSKVDKNDTYDNLKVLNADAEEKYFDDEDPESVHSDSNL